MEELERRISRFDLPVLDELPGDIRERIESVHSKSGFIPNVFLLLARRPAEFRAFFAYHDALMEGNSGLSKAEREMIVVATSAMNDCQYCVIAHGAVLRIRARNPLIADQVATNYHKADLTDREQAMLKLALRIASSAAELSDAELQEARQAGFDEEQLWDIGAIVAFFAMSNRIANYSSLRPNDQFYEMGRSS